MVTWNLSGLERVVRHAGYKLAEAVWDYWPTEGLNDLGERNLSLHLASAFSDRHFRALAECHWKGDTQRKLDLLLLNHDDGVVILVECKRLYCSENAEAIVEDVKRIASFSAIDPKLDGYQRFGIIAATTWNRRIAEWWSTADGAPPSGHVGWRTIEKQKLLRNAHWGSVVLQGLKEDRPSKDAFDRFHYFLYAVFPLYHSTK